MSAPIQAVLTDIGGVVIAIHEERTAVAIAAAAGLSMQDIIAGVNYSSQMARRLDVGEWTLRDAFDAMQDKLSLNMAYEQFEAAWMAMLGDDFPGVRSAFNALPDNVPLYTLSNTNDVHMRQLREHWLFERSRGFFASCEIGSRKPEAEAFEYALKRIALPPERVLFFDDKPDNIAAAEALGIISVLVDDPEETPRTLRELGLIG